MPAPTDPPHSDTTLPKSTPPSHALTTTIGASPAIIDTSCAPTRARTSARPGVMSKRARPPASVRPLTRASPTFTKTSASLAGPRHASTCTSIDRVAPAIRPGVASVSAIAADPEDFGSGLARVLAVSLPSITHNKIPRPPTIARAPQCFARDGLMWQPLSPRSDGPRAERQRDKAPADSAPYAPVRRPVRRFASSSPPFARPLHADRRGPHRSTIPTEALSLTPISPFVNARSPHRVPAVSRNRTPARLAY